MNNRFRIKQTLGYFALSLLIGMTGAAWGGDDEGPNELDLSDVPLFIGDAVIPNVYIEMDDSGSMDWDVLTSKYWHYCAYDSNALGNTGNSNCGYVVDSGLLRLYALPPNGINGSFQYFEYILDSPDDAYGQSCTGSRQTLELCSQATIDADWRARSAAVNVLYYNPEAIYEPWPGKEDADFSKARSDPQPESDGYEALRDLGAGGGFTFHHWVDDKGFDGARPRRGRNHNDTVGANGQVDLWDTHIEYNVTNERVRYREISYAPDNAGMNPTVGDWQVLADDQKDPVSGLTPDEIRQNIANWYQYSRRRSFVAKGAVGKVIDQLPDFRYGLSVINKPNRLTVDLPTADVIDFDQHNRRLVERLYSYNWPAAGTPLRQGLQRVGEYYGETGADAPIIHACQQNFTVLFTDGYWNGGNPDITPSDADRDGYTNTLADVARTYYTKDLRRDLPDRVPVNAQDVATHQHMVTFTVAFGIEGNLKDLDGDGDPDHDAAGNLFVPTPDADWGNPRGSDLAKVDDLWHAAFNSAGSFVAADTPQAVVAALVAALRDIERRSGSAASVALNSGSLGNDTHVYQAKFESSQWSGQLLAFRIGDDGAVSRLPVWDAAERIDRQSHQNRTIVTYNPVTESGVRFRYSANADDNPLALSQVLALMADAPNVLPEDPGDANFNQQFNANRPYVEGLVNFLRGEREHEGNGDADGFRFRERSNKLGDVVHSDPVYVGPPAFRYPDQWVDFLNPQANQPENGENDAYSAFREDHKNRLPMIYFGANDGMLHGVNATDAPLNEDNPDDPDQGGAELLAYVPNALYRRLPELASRNYIHKYFVDGGPTAVDAFFGGRWHTVLLGGLAGGGQGIYALNVTDPGTIDPQTMHIVNDASVPSEDDAGRIVMWEFSDADDADLGYTFSRPAVVRTHNKDAGKKWVAVFGNGYNNTEPDGHASQSGNAVLYIVNLADGSIIKKLDTGVGYLEDPTHQNRPNGLATTAPVDLDGDGIVDYIYAGDLFGNLWKFDVTSDEIGDWGVASFNGQRKPLFQAVSEEGAPQPITSRPEVGRAPLGKPGVMVYFGTGKYLELADNTPIDQATQTFYGIWDNGERVMFERLDGDQQELLQRQEIVLEQRQTFFDGEIPTLYDSADPDARVAYEDPESLFTPDGDKKGNAPIYDEDGNEVVSLNALRGEFDVRTSTDHDVDWSNQKGWYMDLTLDPDDPTANHGERQVSPSVLRNDRIIFSTLLPSNDPCQYGGDSWLMELDAFSGARLPYSPFDFNLDGVFDSEDYALLPQDNGEPPLAVPASGKKSKVGIIPTPAILSGGRGGGEGGGAGDGERFNPCQGGAECKLASGSTGGHEETRENPGKGDFGRQSWREL